MVEAKSEKPMANLVKVLKEGSSLKKKKKNKVFLDRTFQG